MAHLNIMLFQMKEKAVYVVMIHYQNIQFAICKIHFLIYLS